MLRIDLRRFLEQLERFLVLVALHVLKAKQEEVTSRCRSRFLCLVPRQLGIVL